VKRDPDQCEERPGRKVERDGVREKHGDDKRA